MYEKILSLARVTVLVALTFGGLVVAFPAAGTDVRQAASQADDAAARRIRELRDGDPLVRRYAAWALGELESRRGVGPLQVRLRDDDAGVRLVAAWALGEIKERESVGPLMGLLEDADPLVREMAVLSLGEIEEASAVRAILAAAERHPELREPAVWALGEIGGDAAVEAREMLIGQLGLGQGENEEVWTGRLGSREAEPMSGTVATLVATLGDDDPRMRRSAAEWLGKSGDPQAVEPLLDALRDSEPSVRAMAVWALDEINPSRGEQEKGDDHDYSEGRDRDRDRKNEPGIRV
jgi:HEAT repeat protein